MTFDYLIKGLLVGFSIAAPVGPIGVLVIRRTLTEGRLSGLFTGLGAAVADGTYGFIECELCHDLFDVFQIRLTYENHCYCDRCLKEYKNCEENTLEAIKNKTEKIFVANTFTMDWELQPYFKMADNHNYQVFVVTVENYHGSKNIHDIPQEQVEKMESKYKVKLI